MSIKLNQVKSIAKRLGIKGDIQLSSRPSKKFMITVNNKRIHFGQVGYEDFLDHKNKSRRDNFHRRFKSNKGYNDPTSGLYYSSRLLW